MRYPDGTLIGDLSDDVSAKTSSSLAFYKASTTDENLTTYNLLPIAINEPPIITKTLREASTPKIYSYSEVAYNNEQGLYVSPDGSVKVIVGASFQLKMEAEQPQSLNVENGILTVKPVSTPIEYIWRRDGEIVQPRNITDLGSTIVVKQNTLTITNVQPEYAGVYTCEAVNDVGATISEPITLEVLNLDYDAHFYVNLVKNPSAVDGTAEWNASNSLFKTNLFSKIDPVEYLKPNNVDIFGYTPHMMHPQPQQIASPILKGPDYNSLISNPQAGYFTRDSLFFEKKGGAFLVKAYQDIDLTEIEELIKGSVLGVQGVRAVFGCYIGSAIPQFIPNQIMLTDNVGRKAEKYYDLKKPRLSTENILKAGSPMGISETTTVLLEEFDHESRVTSTILDTSTYKVSQVQKVELTDPWKKRLPKYYNKKYFSDQTAGESRSADIRDVIMYTADDMFGQDGARFTYGQYIEFNKVVLERLNKNTTKIRITLSFFTEDPRIYELWQEGMNQSSVVFEGLSYQAASIPNTLSFTDIAQATILGLLKNKPVNQNKQIVDFFPRANEPRGMVTGMNLVLLPVLENINQTNNFTNKLFQQNTLSDRFLVIPYA